MVKELTFSEELVFPAESVTLMVQLLYVPSARALKVMVLLSVVAIDVELLQLPPKAMLPASVELKAVSYTHLTLPTKA